MGNASSRGFAQGRPTCAPPAQTLKVRKGQDTDPLKQYPPSPAGYGGTGVTALVDGTSGSGTFGEVVERYHYDPYGRATVHDASWTERSASAYDDPVQYCGYWLDAETGLHHVRNRYYHSTLGSWTSRDPLGYVDGANLYEYVGGEPIGMVDPWGLRRQASWREGWSSLGRHISSRERTIGERRWERLLEGAGASEAEIRRERCRSERARIELRRVKEANLDGLQETLDKIGYLPVLGEGADAINAGISLARGRRLEAASYGISVVPWLGDAVGKGGRLAARELTQQGAKEVTQRGAKEVTQRGAREAGQQGAKETAQQAPKRGTIYEVPGEGTPSGKPYVGRHKRPDPAKTRRSPDGRNRSKATIIDEYDADNPMEGRMREQDAIDERGGIDNLDNKRNEIDPRKR